MTQQIVERALDAYNLCQHSLLIEKELPSWSQDLHYKILAGGKAYSARFLKENRSPNNVFGEITDEVLLEQTKFCRYIVDKGIPFMRFVSSKEGNSYTKIKWEEENYRFILFEWIEGHHITHCDQDMAREFGKMARQFHDIASAFKSSVFTKKSHLIGYEQFAEHLHNKIMSTAIKDYTLLLEYIELAEKHIAIARTETMDFIIQSDLNPLNILWDDDKNIIGIVDFESIGYGDRIEGLAWLIKWYSRTEGLESSEMSPEVTKAFLQGYKAIDFLRKDDYERLTSLLWLSGCMNWNFVKATISILESGNEEELKAYLLAYKKRGEKLIALVPEAFLIN